ncbi:hypothetical protein GUJ93_ZPchr0010g9320 [Zizania palustris]|uniref:E3 ubiquitin-protein ligase RMA n=1 Tax=Zizania palustris TaxID=103762 RepID=A0A8J6BGM9_ZIZPA|nr:hypothetical protein GUJ93_ZPchr0010g9320 [Zizania palustris]
MEGEGAAAEGSRSRRFMDLNLYLGLPPLPQPPGRIDVALDCPPSLPNSGSSAAGTGEQRGFFAREVLAAAPPPPPPPAELAPSAAAYSPSNALSTPEQVLIDPVAEWLVDPVEPAAAALETPSYSGGGGNGSSVHRAVVVRGLELEVIEACDGLSQTAQVTPATRGVEMINVMRQSAVEARDSLEAMAPELRLRRLIQVSDQHRIGRSGLAQANHSQRENSPEADILVQAIQRSHNSLALRRQKLDGDGKVGGTDAAKNDNCGCNSGFDCHICLEPAKEPVVTPCGHLFCWPCLYQWLHEHSAHSECPVCKGEVLEINVTPIYGRGGDEQVAPNSGIPPRPRAHRTESIRQQLQMPDPRGIASMLRRLIENQELVRGQAASSIGVELTVTPTSRQRARARRQQRQDQYRNAEPPVPAPELHVVNVDTEVKTFRTHNHKENKEEAAAAVVVHEDRHWQRRSNIFWRAR